MIVNVFFFVIFVIIIPLSSPFMTGVTIGRGGGVWRIGRIGRLGRIVKHDGVGVGIVGGVFL